MTLSFAGHLTLLSHFLDRQLEIADTIESRLLNVQGTDLLRTRDRASFDQTLNGCFFDPGALPRDLLRLKGQLAAIARRGWIRARSPRQARAYARPAGAHYPGLPLLGEPSLAGQERPAGVCAKHLLRVHPAYARGSQPPDLG
jgi:hypothetical protein